MVEGHLLFFLLCCCVKDSHKQECLPAKWNSSIKIQLHQNCYQTLREEAEVADGRNRGKREKLCSFSGKTSVPISDVSGKKKKKTLFRRTRILFFFKLVIWSLQSESDDSFTLLIFLSRAIIVHLFLIFIMGKLYIFLILQLLLWITLFHLKDHQQTCNCTKQELTPYY